MSFARLNNLRSSAALRSVGIYTFSNFFAKGISFILLFVYTNPKFITPSENGLLNLFSNSLLFLMPFLSMGIVFSTSTDFFKLDKKQFRNFFTTGFILPLTVMILSMIISWFFRDKLKAAYGFPYSFVWIIPVITFFTFCHEQLLALARNNNEPGVHLKTNVAKTIIELGLSFILVVYFSWHWEGRVAGILTAYVFITLYGFYYFFKRDYLFGKIQFSYLKAEMKYAVPIIAMQASLFCMIASDKFFLSHYTHDNNTSVGIYGVACIFGSVIFSISNGLLQYFFPRVYALLAEEKINYAALRKLFLFYARLMLAGTVAVFIMIYIVYTHLLNEKYISALSYIFIICTGYFVWSITYFFYSFLLYNKQKKKIIVLSAGNILISLCSNYFFISRWGAYGAATATCVTYTSVLFFTMLLLYQYPKKIFSYRHDVS